QFKSEVLPTGEQVSIFTGGVLIGVRTADGSSLVDIAADNALIWSKDKQGQPADALANDLRRPEGHSSRDLEFYLSGNVQIRQEQKEPQGPPPPGQQAPLTPQGDAGTRLLTADEIYLDVSRNVAIGKSASLEFRRRGLAQPLVLRA